MKGLEVPQLSIDFAHVRITKSKCTNWLIHIIPVLCVIIIYHNNSPSNPKCFFMAWLSVEAGQIGQSQQKYNVP